MVGEILGVADWFSSTISVAAPLVLIWFIEYVQECNIHRSGINLRISV